ncbi:uncharacterized protein LOC134840082 isoform X2 [Symsagittifera roscoffensis]|uniref:uncharacterized protein LOC134840082 isoform X2 n=1 Tax=Symsagittifera roscoffensis TaxID=84072 RepID=UPI00307BD21A
MPPEKGGGDHGSPIKPASGFCLFRMPATLSDLAEAVFYLVLLCCLLLSVAVTIRSFIATGSNVTNFELRDVNQHVHPCFLFFGVGFSLDVCRSLKLVAGSTDFTGMLQDGESCVSKSFNIHFTQDMMENWEEHEQQFSNGESDFSTTVRKLMQKKIDQGNSHNIRENLTISLIIVRGPSTWVEQDAIYMRVLAPKENVLHPFYILGSFNETKNSLTECEVLSKNGLPLEALDTLQGVLQRDKAVFRYLPTEAMSLASMFKEEFYREGHLFHTRITLESTVSTTMYNTNDMDSCQGGTYYSSTNPTPLDNATAYPVPGNNNNTSKSPYSGLWSSPEENTTSWDSLFEYEGWNDHDQSIPDMMNALCGGTQPGMSYSESTFRWFDGLIRETNSYNPFDPWSVFSTLTAVVLAVDRIYTTLKRYKTAYDRHRTRKVSGSPDSVDDPDAIPREKDLFVKNGKHNGSVLFVTDVNSQGRS